MLKSKKNKILKKLKEKEDKLLDAIEEFRDFLDETEDDDLSSMGDDFYEALVDFIYDNDKCGINDIRTFTENIEEA